MGELYFRGPAQAFLWAERFAARPALKSIFATYGMPRSGVQVGPDYHERLDLARTITGLARDLQPPIARDVFLLTYAADFDADRASSIEAALRNALLAVWPEAQRGKLQTVIRVAIAEHRDVIGTPRRRWWPLARYGKALGRRQSVWDEGWLPVIKRSRLALGQWRDWGVDELGATLQERGVLD